MKRITVWLLACLMAIGMLIPGTAVLADENEEMILLDENDELILDDENGEMVIEETADIVPAQASDEFSFKGAKKIDNGDNMNHYLITISPGDLLPIDGNIYFNGKAVDSSNYYWVGGLILAKKNKDGYYETEELGKDSSSIAKFDTFNPLVVKAVGPGIVYMGFNSRAGFNGKDQNTYGLNLWIEVKEGKTIECNNITLDKKTAEIAAGSSLQLKATLSPKNTTDKTVTWKSSNPKVASVDENGKVTAKKYGTATITATTSNGKKATCKIQTRFKDVNDPSKPYYKAVYWAVDKGITKCTVNFNPEGSVTRGEFIAFLYRMAGSPEVTKNATKFTDVKSGDKFYKEISWGVANGIIKGFSDKTFRPSDGVTRGQAAIMIWRWAGKPAPTTKESPFTDVKYANTDTAKAILWGSEKGIIKGYSDGTFRKDEACTRANVVLFLYRYSKIS